MAVALRLSRGGTKKRPITGSWSPTPAARATASTSSRSAPTTRCSPRTTPNRVKLDEDRARYWLGVGAQATDRVARFLDAAGIKERAARTTRTRANPATRPRSAPRSAPRRRPEAAAAADDAPAAEEVRGRGTPPRKSQRSRKPPLPKKLPRGACRRGSAAADLPPRGLRPRKPAAERGRATEAARSKPSTRPSPPEAPKKLLE